MSDRLSRPFRVSGRTEQFNTGPALVALTLKWYRRGERSHVTRYHGASEPLTAWFSSLPLAATFMEHWKRKQMRLNYRWDLTGFEEEEVSGLSRCGLCPPPPHPVPFRGHPLGHKVQVRLLPACFSVRVPDV